MTLVTFGETVRWNGYLDRYIVRREQPQRLRVMPTRAARIAPSGGVQLFAQRQAIRLTCQVVDVYVKRLVSVTETLCHQKAGEPAAGRTAAHLTRTVEKTLRRRRDVHDR